MVVEGLGLVVVDGLELVVVVAVSVTNVLVLVGVILVVGVV